MKVTNIIVSVDFTEKENILAHAEVHIPIEDDEPIRPSSLLDACQRSVARCIDELQKHLDILQ